jgi:hypothetical protein
MKTAATIASEHPFLRELKPSHLALLTEGATSEPFKGEPSPVGRCENGIFKRA